MHQFLRINIGGTSKRRKGRTWASRGGLEAGKTVTLNARALEPGNPRSQFNAIMVNGRYLYWNDRIFAPVTFYYPYIGVTTYNLQVVTPGCPTVSTNWVEIRDKKTIGRVREIIASLGDDGQ